MGRIPGGTATALLAPEWVTGSAAVRIAGGTILTVIMAPGLAAASKEKSAR